MSEKRPVDDIIEILNQTLTEIKETREKAKTKIDKLIAKTNDIVKNYNKARTNLLLSILCFKGQQCENCLNNPLDPDETYLFLTEKKYSKNSSESFDVQILRVCRDCSIRLNALNGTWSEYDGINKSQQIFLAEKIVSTQQLKNCGKIPHIEKKAVAEYFNELGIDPEISARENKASWVVVWGDGKGLSLIEDLNSEE